MDTKHATIFKPFHVATTTSALQHYTVVRTPRIGSTATYYQDGQIQHPTKKMCCKHQRFLWTTLMIRVVVVILRLLLVRWPLTTASMMLC